MQNFLQLNSEREGEFMLRSARQMLLVSTVVGVMAWLAAAVVTKQQYSFTIKVVI